MITKLIGIGAGGNKAAICAVRNDIISVENTMLINSTLKDVKSTLKNVKSALNTIAPINNDPTKTVINGGKIQTGTITANSIANHNTNVPD